MVNGAGDFCFGEGLGLKLEFVQTLLVVSMILQDRECNLVS
jgi:hypothetical protein